MIPIGYHHFVPHPDYKPMCYHCDGGSKWTSSTKLDTCCDTQYAKNNSLKKYEFLKSPDFAFSGDIEERANHANQLYTRMYPNQKLVTSSVPNDPPAL
jgi:hypothetical protein